MVNVKGAAGTAGVKPIVGADCWIENPAERDKPFRLLLLCSSRPGYRRLCELLSRAWLANQFRGRALIARRWLEEGCEGLIALSGFLAGELAPPLLSDHAESAERIARGTSELFPGRYYIELQRAGQPNGEALLSRSVALAGRLRLPVVATHPVQFLDADDFRAHEARVCIAQGYLLADHRRPKAFTPEQYFKSQEEMARLFADAPQALDNTIEIARRCNLEIALGKTRLPAFPTPPGVTIDQHLKNEAQAGLARLAAELGLDAQAAQRYRERLAFEIQTIVQIGFAGYFLIVADFINWAMQNGVRPGAPPKAAPLRGEREKNEDEVRELLAWGEKLEGVVRNVGMHAGGVLIAPGRLTEYCPLCAAEGTTNVISQLDKDDVEASGLVKFDFLGLTTLTILDWAERLVRELGLPDLALARIPLDDAATYQLLSPGQTTSVC